MSSEDCRFCADVSVYILFFLSQPMFWRIMGRVVKLMKFAKHMIQEHRSTLDPDSPRDFIDVALIANQQGETEAFSGRTARKSTTFVTQRSLYVGYMDFLKLNCDILLEYLIVIHIMFSTLGLCK